MRALIAGIAAVALTSGGAMAQAKPEERYPQISREEMTPAQREAFDLMAASPRGVKDNTLQGPFIPLIRSPQLALDIHKYGLRLLLESKIPMRLKQLTVLLTAREWNCQYEWASHTQEALDIGIKPETIKAIGLGTRPTTMTADETVVYDLITELNKNKRVSDPTFARAKALFGDELLLEVIGLHGTYTLVAMVLDMAQTYSSDPGPIPLPMPNPSK